jgi:peptide/nickel transport system permease protein
MGRDLMSGMFHGARVSLLFGFSATLAALVVGVTVGALAGY